MPRTLLIILSAFLFSCQQSDQSTAVSEHSTLDGSSSSEKGILIKNRRFVYAVRWYAPEATTATPDTVIMTALGEPWRSDSLQTAFTWLFHPDTTLTSTPQETVGAIENNEQFWLHPPRRINYRILELNPFPDIRFPIVIGKTWEWKVYPPDMYSDSAWATWEGVVTVTHRYTLLDSMLLLTPFGKVNCYRVQATGSSRLGTTALESYFHPSYGFVRLNYRNINNSRVELEMVSEDIQPEWDEKMNEKVFLQPY